MLVSEVGTYLEQAGVGTVGVDLFLGALPSSPDVALAIVPYPGRQPVPARGTPPGVSFELPRLQVLARDTHPAAAMRRAERAYQALLPLANRRLSGTWYLGATPLQSPFSLGVDDAGRHVFAFNVEFAKGLSHVE